MQINYGTDNNGLSLSIGHRHNRVMKSPPRTIRIAWYRSEDGVPGIHFPPALWDMVCTAVERHGGALPQDVIATYMDALIRMNTKVRPAERALINLEWLIYGATTARNLRPSSPFETTRWRRLHGVGIHPKTRCARSSPTRFSNPSTNNMKCPIYHEIRLRTGIRSRSLRDCGCGGMESDSSAQVCG